MGGQRRVFRAPAPSGRIVAPALGDPGRRPDQGPPEHLVAGLDPRGGKVVAPDLAGFEDSLDERPLPTPRRPLDGAQPISGSDPRSHR